jgi:hypothetical protein
MDQSAKVAERQTYTVAEAASIVGISRALAYRRGVLPTIKVAGRRLVPRQALDRLLAANGVSDGGRRSPETGHHEPETAQPADHRGSNRATRSRGPSSPTPGRRKGSPGQSSASAVS